MEKRIQTIVECKANPTLSQIGLPNACSMAYKGGREAHMADVTHLLYMFKDFADHAAQFVCGRRREYRRG